MQSPVKKYRLPFCEPLGSLSSFCASSILSVRQEQKPFSAGEQCCTDAHRLSLHSEGGAECN